ncbi:MAG: polyphenol oxidase family protein [Holosporaceae bacterium]|nr:polyphenol oxidase family protein [Holosporaceae bacterium]
MKISPPHLTSTCAVHRDRAFPEVGYGFFGKNIGNCSKYIGDNPGDVLENLDTIKNLFNAEKLVTLKQIHSNICVAIDSTTAIDPDIEADALVTATIGIAIGVLTADCVPILFWGPSQRKYGENSDERNTLGQNNCNGRSDLCQHRQQPLIIGAAHCGWKGAVGGIIESTIDKITEVAKCKPEDIHAIIGPAIAVESYEISSDFEQNFTNANDCFLIKNDKKYFDLQKFCRDRLRQMAVPEENIQWLNINTYANHSVYFSHRFTQANPNTRQGRNISAICLMR